MARDRKMVITDLDGTLLRSDRTPGALNRQTLCDLERRGVLRVLATGRSCFSLQKVIPPDFPLDYLVFSSGAGIMEWSSKRLMSVRRMRMRDVRLFYGILRECGDDFMIHEPIPRNHRFCYVSSRNPHPDFTRRIELYRGHCRRLTGKEAVPAAACQLLAVRRQEDARRTMAFIRRRANGHPVIRATSPLDGRSLWIEIFPRDVSKGSALEWLRKSLRVDRKRTMAVGNDYNDMDLLSGAGRGFVVENAPGELKEIFPRVPSNDENGFTEAVSRWQRELDSAGEYQ
jgi:hypothetical protein